MERAGRHDVRARCGARADERARTAAKAPLRSTLSDARRGHARRHRNDGGHRGGALSEEGDEPQRGDSADLGTNSTGSASPAARRRPVRRRVVAPGGRDRAMQDQGGWWPPARPHTALASDPASNPRPTSKRRTWMVETAGRDSAGVPSLTATIWTCSGDEEAYGGLSRGRRHRRPPGCAQTEL